MKINALIVEDNNESRATLRMYLEEHGAFSSIDEANTAEDGLFKLMENSPDIVFLDIQLPGKSGIDFLDLLSKKGFRSHFVIVSSSRNFAVNAIKFEVFDYLLKPVNKLELYNVIDKFRLKIITNPEEKLNEVIDKSKEAVKIKFSSNYSYFLVEPDDIVYCEADGGYTDVHLTNGKVELANTYLAKVEEVLVKFNFIRISRSLLINANLIRAINRNENSCTLVSEGREFVVKGSRKLIKMLSQMDF